MELEYVQPFNNAQYVHSDEILSKYYVSDKELLLSTSSGVSLKRKALEPPKQKYEKIVKKVK